ncbi:MAG TPA: branched-chain amino acid ABC transporter permease [Desulfobacterales bacterium]|nr:branched-chain amino acid ABC transporter permease [Desulfobacterales bacterium]
MDTTIFLQLIVSGLLIGFVFSLIAVGLTLIWGVMDILNFAHGDFLMLAMFSSFLMFANLGLDPLLSLPMVVALLFMVGLLTFRWVIRPVLGYPGLIALLATFGLSIFIRNLVLFFVGPNYRVINQSVLAGKNFSILGLHFSLSQTMSAIGCVLITYAVYLLIARTKFGRSLRATSLDKDTALLMGINTNRVFALTFGLGAACVGFAGGMLSNFYPIFPEVGLNFAIMSFVIVALGGFGNISGAFLAGIFVGLVENVGGFLIGPEFKYTLVFVLYLIVISIRPKGLFGW